MARSFPIGSYFADNDDPQRPSDVAVVVPSILRPQLINAIESIYRQDFPGRVQIAIGIDRPIGDFSALRQIIDVRPPRVSILLLELPYSTSVRHGGIHSAMDGGALRSILSFMANTRFVAYLDDDNRWRPQHLTVLTSALSGRAWAHSLRMLVDEATGTELAIDRWDSVGVARGRFAPQGGFVDPSCIIVDKIAAYGALGCWCETADGTPGVHADRNFFAALARLPHARVEQDTVLYAMRPNNVMHAFMKNGTEFL